MYPTSLFSSLSGHRCSTAAVDECIWSPGGCLEKIQRAEKGREVQGGSSLCPPAVVGRVPGTVIWCTKRNKNHIARDFHSFTAQQVTALYFHSGMLLCSLLQLLSNTGCCYGVKGINIGEVRRVLCSTLSKDFKRFFRMENCERTRVSLKYCINALKAAV